MAGLAVVCIPTAISLICIYPNNIPPILPSVLLATGLAALTYRFLGGFEGASFQIQGFKAAGGLAALGLITYGINFYLESQDPDTRKVIYTISGTVVDDQQKPVRIQDTDISVDPTPVTVQKSGIGSFTVEFPKDVSDANDFIASIRISHIHCSEAPDDRPADIETCHNSNVPLVTLASEPITIASKNLDRKRRVLSIGRVRLNNQAKPNPDKDLKPVTSPPSPFPGVQYSRPQAGNQ